MDAGTYFAAGGMIIQTILLIGVFFRSHSGILVKIAILETKVDRVERHIEGKPDK